MSGLRHVDEDDRALEKLTYAERMEHHRKRVWAIQAADGSEGVKAYKAKHPEAQSIQTQQPPPPFYPKPAGYNTFLCKTVDTWLVSDIALNESNRATVDRLNVAMSPRRFNPDNHFSGKLPATILRKLAEVFACHGAHLDIDKADTMSKIRAAVKAHKVRGRTASRPFGSLGTISGNQLVIGSESFAIQKNGARDCIRPAINGSKRRLYLDELLWLATLLADPPPSTSLFEEVRDGDYLATEPSSEPLSAPNADPLTNGLPEIRPKPCPLPETGPKIPDLPRSLAERIAALRAAQQPHSTAYSSDPDADPLASKP